MSLFKSVAFLCSISLHTTIMSITEFFINVQPHNYKIRNFGQFSRTAGENMIHSERITSLNSKSERKGEYVLYWMQQSARAHYNHALELALRQAASLKLPLLVAFVLTDNFPEANQRHYRFLLEGVEDTRARLAERGVQMLILHGEPVAAISAVAARAALLLCDCGYLRIQRQWRAAVAASVECRCVQVESDVVVPVETAYPKEAYTAGILRPKLHAVLEKFSLALPETPVQRPSLGLD